MSAFADQLVEDFDDKEFAHGYMEDHGNTVIAAQIKTLREQRELSQEALAQLAGMKQERISALENVDYDAWTIKTLRKLGKAFDVHVMVTFVPFSQAIMDVVNLRRERLEVPCRETDLAMFRNQRLFHRNGAWTVIDTKHLAEVKNFHQDQPVELGGNGWQSLQPEDVQQRANHG